MDNRGYYSSSCLDEKEQYTLSGLEDDLEYKWAEMTIERCNRNKSNCATDDEINDFI